MLILSRIQPNKINAFKIPTLPSEATTSEKYKNIVKREKAFSNLYFDKVKTLQNNAIPTHKNKFIVI